MPAPIPSDRRTTALAIALTLAIVELALTSAYIHASLGGVLFTLNAIGYVGLAALVAAGLIPHPIVRRLAWLPRVALAAFTATTIVAYLVIGPYFTLGWVAKAIEVAVLVVIAADLVRLYGSLAGVAQAVRGALRGTVVGASAG